MASLKSLLRSALTSFRNSHKSVPIPSWIAIDQTVTSGGEHIDDNTYVAPSDGTLTIQAEAPSYGLVIRKSGMDWFTGGYEIGPWYSAWVQCKAGETINWAVSSTSPTTACHLRFYKYVGE